jgi:hypothetical protein
MKREEKIERKKKEKIKQIFIFPVLLLLLFSAVCWFVGSAHSQKGERVLDSGMV